MEKKTPYSYLPSSLCHFKPHLYLNQQGAVWIPHFLRRIFFFLVMNVDFFREQCTCVMFAELTNKNLAFYPFFLKKKLAICLYFQTI